MNAVAYHFLLFASDTGILTELGIVIIRIVPAAFALNKIVFVFYSCRSYEDSRIVCRTVIQRVAIHNVLRVGAYYIFFERKYFCLRIIITVIAGKYILFAVNGSTVRIICHMRPHVIIEEFGKQGCSLLN